jgi:hypothetical protein
LAVLLPGSADFFSPDSDMPHAGSVVFPDGGVGSAFSVGGRQS